MHHSCCDPTPHPYSTLTDSLATTAARARKQLPPRLASEYLRNLAIVEAAEARTLLQATRIMSDRRVALMEWLDEAAKGRTDDTPDPLKLGVVPVMVGSITDLMEGMAVRLYSQGGITARRDLKEAEAADERDGLGNLLEDARAIVAARALEVAVGLADPGPDEAIEYVISRRELFRWFDANLVEDVRASIVRIINEGMTTPEARVELEKTLGHYTRARLTNVVRTESMSAFNAGRMAYYEARAHLLVGIRFIAVVDHRTTIICAQRDGIHLPLSHPLLRVNIPPLHYQCRSVWSPMTRRRWRRAVQEAMGVDMPFDEAEAKFVAENVRRLRAAKPVMRGFGGGGSMGAEAVAPILPEPSTPIEPPTPPVPFVDPIPEDQDQQRPPRGFSPGGFIEATWRAIKRLFGWRD